MTTKFQIPVNQRVRLRGDRADVYTFAVGGSEGWVRKQRLSNPGEYRMVYIEWDPEHWTYNGEPNIWTYEDHFDIVENEDHMTDDEPKNDSNEAEVERAIEYLRTLIRKGPKGPNEQRAALPESDAELSKPTESESVHVGPDGYIAAIEEAFDAASEADAFLMVAVNMLPSPLNPNETVLMPVAISAYLDESAGLALEAQLSHMAAMAHEESNRSLIRKIRRNES